MYYTRNCLKCQREFYTTRELYNYCPTCSGDDDVKEKIKAEIKERRSKLIKINQIVCRKCGKEFSTYLNNRTLCKKCFWDFTEQRKITNSLFYDGIKKELKFSQKKHTLGELTIGVCDECSKTIAVPITAWRGNKPVFCDECKPITVYPPEFDQKLKERIRRRDGHVCQNCGITEKEHNEIIGRALAIHHIDYNNKNCVENNLITLCVGCNVRANTDRDNWQNIFTKLMSIHQ